MYAWLHDLDIYFMHVSGLEVLHSEGFSEGDGEDGQGWDHESGNHWGAVPWHRYLFLDCDFLKDVITFLLMRFVGQFYIHPVDPQHVKEMGAVDGCEYKVPQTRSYKIIRHDLAGE